MAVSVSSIAGLLFLCLLLREIQEEEELFSDKKWMKTACLGLAAVSVILQGVFEVRIKINQCFLDDSPAALHYQMEDGPAKGIITNEAKYTEYENLCHDIQGFYQNKTPGRILFLTEHPWCWLMLDDFPYSTYSAWLCEKEEYCLEKLRTWYSLNPEKIPVYIYIPTSASVDYEEALQNGYTAEKNEFSCKLTRER